MKFGVVSDIGMVRETNQDSHFTPEDESMPLFMVADGMGGHNAGEVASGKAIEKVEEWMKENIKELTNIKKIENSVAKSIEYANKHIFDYSKTSNIFKGMGTTLTMGYIFNNKIIIGHVGDSRAYLIKNFDIVQITQDHSLVQQLIKEGKISQKEAKSHPQRNIITRAVGIASEIKIDVFTIDVNQGNIVVLCSDGLSNMISEKELAIIFSEEKDVQRACKIVVEKAKFKGGNDNITVLGIRF